MTIVRLHHDGRAVLLDDRGPVPSVLHWGPDPGPVPDGAEPLLTRPQPPGLLPPSGPGTPMIALRTNGDDGRPGLDLGPGDARWGPCELTATSATTATFTTSGAGARLDGSIELGPTLRVEVSVTNTGTDALPVHRLQVSLPVDDAADELLTFEGRWAAEFAPVRTPWPGGTVAVENRRGRTSHDRVPLLFAGRRGFGERAGAVHGVHVAWSGNTEVRAECTVDGRRSVQAGELLLGGEVVLAAGATYAAPVVHGVWGDGLVRATQGFHAEVRRHQPATPRPVVLNTWEAVYFDHDADRLRALADRAADVGVERFVLDDGWFGGRRDDTAGLGDWWVSPDAHPDGLAPLIAHVRALGMGFGIWVEPEMVNPDSDLYRAHPEWVLGDTEVLGRNQHVLDLSIDGCREHLFDRLDALLRDHDFSFVKWDMNRDVLGAGAHAQTVALHRLLDDLRAAHPDVEIESCSSGGGRVDLGILTRTERVWTSDSNDALDRQRIQRGASHLIPPSVMGAHIGPARAHTTGRTHRLHFRAATAFFGHLGIEWDLLDATDRHRDALAWWIARHRELRPLLHGGDVVRLDSPDPAGHGHGVVAADAAEALFCWAQLTSSTRALPPRLRLDGLDPDRTYRVTHLAAPGEVLGLAAPPPWMRAPVDVSGRFLTTVGLQLPVLHPESAVLMHLT